MEQADMQTRKGHRKGLWATAAIVVIAAGGVFAAKTFYEAKVNEAIARSGATARSVEVDFLGKIHLRDLSLPLGDGTTVRIATVDGRPKLPLLKGALELGNVGVETPTGTISMAHARIDDASIEKVAGADGAPSASKRIARFAAKQIASPEVLVTQSIATVNQKAVYKDVALIDIANGNIARYSAASSSFDVTVKPVDGQGDGKDKHVTVSTGAIAGQDFDAAYAARLYTEKAGPDDKQLKRLYGPFSVHALTFAEGEGHFSYDEIRSEGFTVRMPSEPLLETFKALAAVNDPNELPIAERRVFVAKVLSLFDIIGESEIQVLGLKGEAPDQNAPGTGKKINVSIDQMASQLKDRTLNVNLNRMSIGSGSDIMEIGEASLTGFDWTSTIEAFRQFNTLDEEQMKTFEFNRLMPTFGTMRLAKMNVDMPNTAEKDDSDGTEPERIKFTLGNFEMALTKPFNGIPTDVQIKQQDLTVPIQENALDEASIGFRRMGFQAVTISSAFSMGWNQTDDSLVIRDVSASGKDLGSVNFSGLLGGVTEEFFSLDTNRTQAALFGLAVRDAKLTVKDEGMLAKAIKLYAEDNNVTEAQARSNLETAANVGLQQLASEHPKLKAVADSVLQFFKTPGTLTITTRAKGPNGLGVLDFVAASQDPMLLLDKVEIEAVAN